MYSSAYQLPAGQRQYSQVNAIHWTLILHEAIHNWFSYFGLEDILHDTLEKKIIQEAYPFVLKKIIPLWSKEQVTYIENVPPSPMVDA